MPAQADQDELFKFTQADLFVGHRRLREALGAIDVRTAEILACHIVVSRAVTQVLHELTPRADLLDGLGLQSKVDVLRAFSDHEAVELMTAPVVALERLRNVVAHEVHKRKVAKAYAALCKTLEVDPDTTTVAHIAHAIVTGLGIVQKATAPVV